MPISNHLSLSFIAAAIKQKNLFADNTDQINRSTYEIKQDIQTLNESLEGMGTYITSHRSTTNKHNASHTENVLNQLQTRLMEITMDFKSCLQDRTESMKVDHQRRGQFGLEKPSALGKPLLYKPATIPRPSGTGSNRSSLTGDDAVGMGGGGMDSETTPFISPVSSDTIDPSESFRRRKVGSSLPYVLSLLPSYLTFSLFSLCHSK
jgi:hypothetical protein